MSKNDKNIDAYSKALLDKKTEYNDELKKPKVVHQMSEAERRQAEKTMSSALDMLRKERGQKTIEEEEQFYQEHEDDLKDMDDDFTTSSIEKEQSNEALDLVHAMLKNMSNEGDENEEVVIQKEKNPNEKKEKKEHKPKEKKSKNKQVKEKKPLKKITKIVLCVILVGLVALGGYAYKVLVYDPQNIVSETQQKTYDKLVSYADEYGDNMMSDAEKYKALLKDMKQLHHDKEEVKLPAYQQIVGLLNGWESKSDEEKMAVADMQSTYSSLSKNLKDEVDTLSKSKTGKDFIDLCKEQGELKAAAEEKARQEEEAKKAENEKKVKEYQTSLNSLQQDYNTYAQYAQSLESDLAYAQQNGEDTADIQSQIDTNNQMLSSLQQQITYYQQQISALQS